MYDMPQSSINAHFVITIQILIFLTALLTDDVRTAINCAKRVVRDPNGIRAW